MPQILGFTKVARAAAVAAIIPPATEFWLGLFTTLPTAEDGSGGVEVSNVGTGYARAGYAGWTPAEVVLAGGAPITHCIGVTNAAEIDFATLTAAVAGVVGFGLWDAAGGGNLIGWGALEDVTGAVVTRSFAIGDAPAFPASAIVIGFVDIDT